MSTIVLWILLTTNIDGGVAVIEKFVSQEDCIAARSSLESQNLMRAEVHTRRQFGYCIQVKAYKP